MESAILQPIKEPAQLFGRGSLVNKIYARIGAARPQSVSLVGDCKVGKTSLLLCLAAKETCARMLRRPEDYAIVFLSISELKIKSVDAFVQNLHKAMQPHLPGSNELSANDNRYDWFKKAAEEFTQQGKKIILFFDDFNLITQNEEFPLEFFSFLRSVANNYNVAYVTTSYLDLQKLCVSKDVEESPFFNIFTNMMIKGLDKNDANDLMQAKLDGISETQRDKLWALCGGFPYLIKLACAASREKNLPPDDEAFERAFYKQSKSFFALLWERFESEHRHILEKVVRGQKINPRQHYLLHDLERKGYVYSNGKPTLFSPAFANFIAEIRNIGVLSDSSPMGLLKRIFQRIRSTYRTA